MNGDVTMLYITGIEKSTENKHSREHRTGKMLLGIALREEYGIRKLPIIEKREHGKPYFPDYAGIHFNISHAADMAVCVVAQSELGVDIEAARTVREALLRRVLTEAERDWFMHSQDKEEAFIRLWTLKESYVKATGEGLGADFTKIEFQFPASLNGEVLFRRTDAEKQYAAGLPASGGYSFYQQKVGRKTYLAVCIRQIPFPDELKKLHIIF